MLVLSINDIKGIIAQIFKEVKAQKDYLIELDSAMGDGDLGLTMVKGFNAALEELNSYTDDDIGKALYKSGMVMANSAAATMGTIIATGLMSSGKASLHKDKINLSDIIDMGWAAVEGIKKRGKADVGDKTVLDAIVPGIKALEESNNNSKSLKNAFEKASVAAEDGFKSTRDMISKFGRARYYGENSKGKLDPGAAVGSIIFKAIYDYLND